MEMDETDETIILTLTLACTHSNHNVTCLHLP